MEVVRQERLVRIRNSGSFHCILLAVHTPRHVNIDDSAFYASMIVRQNCE